MTDLNDRIEKELEPYLQTEPNQNSRKSYNTALKHLFEELRMSPSEYLSTQRNYYMDIARVITSMLEKGYLYKSLQGWLSTWLKYLAISNNIELTRRQEADLWKKVSGSTELQKDVPRTPTTYRRILYSDRMPIHGRAAFLVQISTGRRLGEVLKLKVSDIDLEHDPPTVRFSSRGTKTKQALLRYLTSEAKEAIDEWLVKRSEYIGSSSAKCRGIKTTKDVKSDRLFPFSAHVPEAIWNRALENTGLTKIVESKLTKRRTITPHGIRAYVRYRLGKVDPQMADIYCGWKNGSTGHDTYVGNNMGNNPKFEEDLEEFFKAAEHLLMIASDTSALEAKMEEQNEKVDYLLKREEERDKEQLRLRMLNDEEAAKRNRLVESVQKKLQEKDITNVTAEELLELTEAELERERMDKLIKQGKQKTVKQIFG